MKSYPVSPHRTPSPEKSGHQIEQTNGPLPTPTLKTRRNIHDSDEDEKDKDGLRSRDQDYADPHLHSVSESVSFLSSSRSLHSLASTSPTSPCSPNSPPASSSLSISFSDSPPSPPQGSISNDSLSFITTPKKSFRSFLGLNGDPTTPKTLLIQRKISEHSGHHDEVDPCQFTWVASPIYSYFLIFF